MKEFLGTVEDLVNGFDDVAVAINRKDGAVQLFDREDVDYIPEDLLAMNVKKFRYLPKNPKRRVPILEIDI